MKQKLIFIISALFLLPILSNAQSIETGKLPNINSIAVHQGRVEQYFVATSAGLYSSDNNGLRWTNSGNYRLPVTVVSEPTKGSLYAFHAMHAVKR